MERSSRPGQFRHGTPATTAVHRSAVRTVLKRLDDALFAQPAQRAVRSRHGPRLQSVRVRSHITPMSIRQAKADRGHKATDAKPGGSAQEGQHTGEASRSNQGYHDGDQTGPAHEVQNKIRRPPARPLSPAWPRTSEPMLLQSAARPPPLRRKLPPSRLRRPLPAIDETRHGLEWGRGERRTGQDPRERP